MQSQVIEGMRDQRRARRWSRWTKATVGLMWFLVIGGASGALGAAWLADWRLDVVQTPSMVPTVPTDSLAAVSPVSPQEVRKLDVISFNDPSDRRRKILHRVIQVIENEGSGRFFKTQGDANATADPLLVPARDVRGVLRFHVPRVGGLLRSLKPPVSYVVLMGPPMLFLLWGEVRRRRHREPALVPEVTLPTGAKSTELFADDAPLARALAGRVGDELRPGDVVVVRVVDSSSDSTVPVVVGVPVLDKPQMPARDDDPSRDAQPPSDIAERRSLADEPEEFSFLGV